MGRLRIILFIAAVAMWQPTMAEQDADSVLVGIETELAGLSEQLAATRYSDASQDTLATRISQMLGEALRRDNSFDYPFDRLKNNISFVASPDGKLRIFTWFSVGDAGNYHYYGYLQYNDKQNRQVKLFELNDCGSNVENYENMTFSPQNWRGMLYYAVVEKKSQGDVSYTLIGWDGCGLYTTKKIIEPLTFTDKGQPRFGKSMIKVGHKKLKRLVFEYNKRASLMVQYDANLDMIIFDHLTIMGTQETDNPLFFAPDMSYDALKFEDGTWFYQTNIKYKRPAPSAKEKRQQKGASNTDRPETKKIYESEKKQKTSE